LKSTAIRLQLRDIKGLKGKILALAYLNQTNRQQQQPSAIVVQK
jgi:hypothetical protein